MKVKQMETTKEAVKRDYLDKVAEKTGEQWHSQAAHKLAVGVWFLDMLQVADQATRDEAMKQWQATPSSFGSNASALGQALGRKPTNKTEETFKGF